MAREVLTIGGAALGFFFGGPAGAALGAQIGGYAGALVDPADPIEGPRLSDLQVTASTYGTPIPLIYGPTNRISGNVIWSTGLIESSSTTRTGGKGGGGGQKVTEYSYRMSLAIALGAGVVQGIKRISANSKLIFDIDALTTPPPAPSADVGMVVVANADSVPDSSYGVQAGGPYAVLRFYQGTGTQQIDPTIEAYLGVGNTPAYRHTAYLVIQDLQLADYGNAMPNIEVEVVGQESIKVRDVVQDIFDRAGMTNTYTDSLDMALRGYVVSQAGPAYQAIQPLTRAYNFDLVEQLGEIRCVRRTGYVQALIPITDMGCRPAGDDSGIEPIRFLTASDTSMPREVAVNYSDPAMEYQVNTQVASRTAGSSENNMRVEMPMVLTAEEARRLADRELWEAWTARRRARFTLSDRWIRLSPGAVVGLPVAGMAIPHRIVKLSRGHDGVIEVDAVYEDPEIYDSTAAGASPAIPGSTIKLPGLTRELMLDIPILRDQDDDTGFYVVAAASGDGWRGAELERSVDGGSSFSSVGPLDGRSVIGDVATALPAGPANIWDRGNTLTVVLHDERDELEGVSELNVLNGRNAAWVGPPDGAGGEIIQFTTATLVAPKTYELSGLLRGRRGTEHAIGTHGPDEVFVLLQAETLQRQDFGLSDLGLERVYRPVSNYTQPSDNPTQTFTNTGAGRRPFSPVHVRGVRDSGNDLTISWIRRTRYSTPGLGRGEVPLGETVEHYRVDVLSGMTVVRSITASTPSVVYTAAQQTADGLTPGDPVSVVVYQLSGLDVSSIGTAATI